MSVVLVERVIQVTVNPVELWHMTKEEWHLRVVIGCVVEPSSDWVEGLVGVRVHDPVTQVVMLLLPVILWHV